MDSTHNSVKSKVNALIDELKKLSNYELKKLNVNIVLFDKSTDKEIKLSVDESHNFKISTGKVDQDVSETSDDETSDDETEQTEQTEQSEQTEGTTEYRSISSNNTLSTKIFNNSVVSDSEMQTTPIETRPDKESGNGLRGGFKNSSVTLSDILGGNSYTSDFSTVIDNVFSKQASRQANKQSGGYAPNTISQTSDAVVPNPNAKFSSTSNSEISNKFSATSSDFSATSPMQQGAGYPVNFSATSNDSNKKYLMKGGVNYSATSELTVNPGIKRGVNYSATSELTVNPMKGGGDVVQQVSKFDLIKQKIRELELGTEREVFSKSQSGGANKKLFDKLKKDIGINSSSTSDICE